MARDVAARLDLNWLMLDNRHMVMIEDRQVRRYRPLFLVDRDSVKFYSDAAISVRPVENITEGQAEHGVEPEQGLRQDRGLT
jgi:hypothetical protein